MRIAADFITNEDGATAIEYAMIASLVSIAAYATMSSLGLALSSLFGTISSNMG